MTQARMVVDASWVDEDMFHLIKELMDQGVEILILPSDEFQSFMEVPRD